MRRRAPANVFLHRAQLILLLSVLVPTILTTPVGIVLLAGGGSSAVALVSGILVLAFAASSVTGFVLGSLFLRRGARLVRVQNDFLSAVSHELRTPITSMRMFVEALLDERLEDPGERERSLRSLHREIARLDALVGRLIDLTRIEAGRQPFEKALLSVDDLVAETVGVLHAGWATGDPHLEIDVEPGLEVEGDREALIQVLVNLLSNARKHGGEACPVRLTAARRPGGGIEIGVADEGPGIPSSEHKRIFEKFERGRAAVSARTAGSGLGLAIARAFVRAHGGRLELESSSASGTTFRILLPPPRHPACPTPPRAF